MYIVREEVIRSNVDSIRRAFYNLGVDLKLCYSYKTNSMPEVLDVIADKNVCPEVVSMYEYRMIPDASKHRVVCNGVAMTYEELAERIVAEDLVNFNDLASARKVRKIIGSDEQYRVGLRVRFDNDSRFGVHKDDLSNALNELRKMNFRLDCLHCHVTDTRGLERYRQKVRSMIDLILENDIRPDIDLGGSMYGKMDQFLASQFEDVGSFNDYAEIIAEETDRLNYTPKIILELGTALIANAVSVVGKVIRIDEYDRVVLDIDKFTIGMIRSKNLCFKHFPDCSCGNKKKYAIYGCTCIEDDLLVDDFEGEVELGDTFEFMNCGAYSHCFEPAFIIPKQEVVVI